MSSAPESILVGSIQKFSIEDGPGIRTTIFIKGCPLNCKWCHNPELIYTEQELIKSTNNCIGCGHCIEICPQSALEMNSEEGVVIDRLKCNMCLKCADECYANALRPVAKPMTIREILDLAGEDKGFYDNTGGGVTLSGGEILMHGEFINKLINEANKREINVCIDTSGFGDSKTLMEMSLMENVTHILYDLKSIDDEVHKEFIGVSNKLILKNLKMLAADKRTVNKLILRMPLIKGVNDTEEIIRKTGDLYREIGVKQVNLIPYHNLGLSKERNLGGEQKEFEHPSEERIIEIKDYFSKINLKVEVLGKI